MENKTITTEEEHQECPHCGTLGIYFEWEDGIPVWICKCGAKWKDTRWLTK